VCVLSFCSGHGSKAPYGCKPACVKRAATPVLLYVTAVTPDPESLLADQAAYTEALFSGLGPERTARYMTVFLLEEKKRGFVSAHTGGWSGLLRLSQDPTAYVGRGP